MLSHALITGWKQMTTFEPEKIPVSRNVSYTECEMIYRKENRLQYKGIVRPEYAELLYPTPPHPLFTEGV